MWLSRTLLNDWLNVKSIPKPCKATSWRWTSHPQWIYIKHSWRVALEIPSGCTQEKLVWHPQNHAHRVPIKIESDRKFFSGCYGWRFPHDFQVSNSSNDLGVAVLISMGTKATNQWHIFSDPHGSKPKWARGGAFNPPNHRLSCSKCWFHCPNTFQCIL